ncbi:M43 family zinc metalloprotease [Flavobacterium sp.]|uniref:M43 family zinc metalloprotease n=1 Tax=Flavobacterium sp. TaxID=239 RepID=UPI00263620E6|nr:M43 family zinc metalloprotease [Flavobacterium sp.]
MKKITLLTLISVLSFSMNYAQNEKHKSTHLHGIKSENINPSNGIIRCATSEYEELLREQDPKRFTKEEFDAFLAPFIEQYNNTPANASQSGGIIYIPVVVHVIHNGDAYGTNENIADEQVQSQITVMTQDYRRMAGTPGFNSSSVGADVQIEFVLAKVDPNGNPTNGINRVNLCRDNYNAGTFAQIQTLIDTEVKPQTIWDPTQYMNMWSVNWDGSGLLGYAQFPSTGTTTANTDGVVAGHSYFGSRTLYAAGSYGDTTYDKGRTMTHEVGHFLGLYHTFQGGCTAAGDSVSDTPAVATANYGCPTGTDSCPATGVDMIENYMDYTDDSCMNIFTTGQKAVITSVMNSMPRRSTLKTSVKDVAIALFANDAEIKIENSCGGGTPTCATPNPTLPLKVISLYNRGTATLTSATISYNIDGGTAYLNNWTGSLAPNKFAYITLANTAVNGTLNVSITNVNGGADARATNNTASKTFGGSTTSISNHNFTTFTFNLTGDRYGTETSWNLKNAAGTTLYSGGPYTNLTANGTQPLVTNQTWTLPANGCYTFTLNDSYGDGLCCTYGAGSYTITTNSGATTVASGGTFTTSSIKYFTNNALSTQTFDSFSDVYVYPNPTKSNFSIAIPNGVELPNSLAIYNSIGQLIESKKVNNVDDLTINSSSYSVGVYFITIENNDSKKTLQLIKE